MFFVKKSLNVLTGKTLFAKSMKPENEIDSECRVQQSKKFYTDALAECVSPKPECPNQHVHTDDVTYCFHPRLDQIIEQSKSASNS